MKRYEALASDDAVLIVLCGVRDGRLAAEALNEVIDSWRLGLIGRTTNAPGAVGELRQLRDGIRRVLDLRSSFEADRGNDVPLVGNLQAREMLERLAGGR